MSAPPGLNVLVTEPIMARVLDVLTRQGTSPHTWDLCFDLSRVPRPMGSYEVLVCSSVTSEALRAMTGLRLVHVTGAGYDKIPLHALDESIALANTFHHGRSIAEHVMMTSMMLLRGVQRSDRDMRAGRWSNVTVTPDYPFGGVLGGRTLGVVGFGEIGAAVARAGSALGMRVRTVRRNPRALLPEGLDTGQVDWVGRDDQLHELLAASDVVVVTVPLSETTRGLIDADALSAMRTTAILINVARGAVVDEQSLHDALTSGEIAGAGIDVWWRNVRDADAPTPSHLDFTALPNVVLTPHQSGHTEEVFAGRAGDISDNIDALADGRDLRHVVLR